MAVVHYGIAPSSVVEDVAGAVARTTDHEHLGARIAFNEIRNLEGPYLETLRKLDRDGGIAPVAYPACDSVEFEIEHLGISG